MFIHYKIALPNPELKTPSFMYLCRYWKSTWDYGQEGISFTKIQWYRAETGTCASWSLSKFYSSHLIFKGITMNGSSCLLNFIIIHIPCLFCKIFIASCKIDVIIRLCRTKLFISPPCIYEYMIYCKELPIGFSLPFTSSYHSPYLCTEWKWNLS